MMNYKHVLVLTPALFLVILVVVVPSAFSSAGGDLASQYEQIWGDPDQFATSFEDELKPMLNQYMGLGIAAAGFGIVARSLLKG
jgi:hypothetical protein